MTCVVSQLAGPDAPGVDPESLRAVRQRFHDAGRAVFASHGGSVVELRSDAVVAVLGMPVAHEDEAQRALRAAAELRDERCRSASARSGACTGEVVAAGDPPVIGEAVAVAERLARSAAGGEIRLAESTWQVVRHAAHARRSRTAASCSAGSTPTRPQSRAGFDQPLIGRERRWAPARRRSRASPRSARRSCSPSSASPASASRAWSRELARSLANRDRAHRPLPRVRRGHHAVAAARGRRAGAGRPRADELAAALGIPAVAVAASPPRSGSRTASRARTPTGRSCSSSAALARAGRS